MFSINFSLFCDLDEDGQATKTLLCFMVFSVAGHFQDVICLPVVNLTSGILHKNISEVVQRTHKAGLNVVALSMDNYSANRKFYIELCGGELKPNIENPIDPNKHIFLLLDTVHNFKNIYNNSISKKEFICSPFINKKIGNSKISHIQKVYNMELVKPLKIAHRLSEKVSHPTTIEKTNVKLADALFHNSTINALLFYADNGYPEFYDTAHFLKIVRKMWNVTS